MNILILLAITIFSCASAFAQALQSLSFDGADDYVEISSPLFDGGVTSAFTIECWFQSDQNDGTQGGLWGKHASWQEANLSVYGSTVGAFYAYDSPNQYVTFTSGFPYSQLDWHHVAWCMNGSEMRFYLDGTLAETANTPGAISWAVVSGTHRLASMLISSTYHYLNGSISEFRVSSAARYSSDFIPSCNQFIPDSLTELLYHFDENTGNTVIDHSGNGNNGLIQGNPLWSSDPTCPCPPTPLPFFDDFSSSELDSCWFWVREDTSHWSLTEREGWMRIETQDGEINQGTSKNLLLRPKPEGNFSVETRVAIQPISHHNGLGIILYNNDSQLVLLQRTYSVGQMLNFWDPSTGLNTEIALPDTNLYLRLQVFDTLVIALWSSNGIVWNKLASHVSPWLATANFTVGIEAKNGGTPGGPEIPADFDYFRIDSLSGTTVCGNISGVWTAENSPYYVTCDVTVPAGQTLAIQPGVEVLFTGHYKFNVNGNLQAIGTEQDSIVFTRAYQTEESRWAGLQFYTDSSSASQLTFCIIEHGFADTLDSAGGGGVYCESSSPNFSHCSIVNCFGGTGGGAFLRDGSSSYFTDCIFNGNTSSGSGGGFSCVFSSAPTLLRCVFTDNTAASGGAIFTRNDAELTVINCTIVENTATSTGGGLYNRSGNTTTILRNCIFWDNASPNTNEIFVLNGGVDINYSDIQGGYPGAENINLDPLFVDTVNGDFHLQEESPCINSGDPGSPPDPDGTRTDMGAFPFYIPYQCGNVSGVWYAGVSPYQVSCDLTVPAGDSLIIEPGVEVKFLGDYSIFVDGTLIAEGTEQDSILFWADTLTNPNRWSGVRYRHAQGENRLAYCNFLNGSSITGDAFLYGGAVFVDSSLITIEHCIFENNQARWGGAVAASRALPGSLIDGCIFKGNRSVNVGNSGAGGALRVSTYPITLSHSLFINNSANYGGAVEITLLTDSITNCTFVDNTAVTGGAASYSFTGHPTYNSCVFSDNTGPNALHLSGGSTAQVTSSTWHNMPANFSNLVAPAGFGELTQTNVNGDSVDTYSNLFVDPLFASELKDLSWNSPSIDAGDSNLPADLDGTLADQGWKSYYQPTLIVSPEAVDFGTLYFGDTATLDLTVINPSPADAPILEQLFSNVAFSMDSLPDWIASSDTIIVPIEFIPPMEGTYNETLRIVSRLVGADTIEIPLYATVPLVPSAVDSLVITLGALNGTQLYWKPVTTTTSGQPFTPAYYIIYGSTTAEGPFTPFGVTATTSFHHPFIVSAQAKYFYFVTASDGSSVTGLEDVLKDIGNGE